MTLVWRDFCDTKAYATLSDLAQTPVDLSSRELWARGGRLRAYCCRDQFFELHYGTEQVSEKILDGLQDLADEVQLVEKFRRMRRGAVLNRLEGFASENRQVLHTASRDIFAEDPAEPGASKAALAEVGKLEEFLAALDDGQILNEAGEKFDTLVHVGIGGSDLGPRAIFEALKAYKRQDRSVHFIANVDPDDAAAVLGEVNLATSLVAIVSKSGTTLETLANELLVREALTAAGLDPCKHCLAVTGKGSPMDDPAKYLRSFYMFDYVGGRYSVTSMVGMVALGFGLGISAVKQFLQGAASVDLASEESDIRKNVALLLALLGIWNHNFLGYPTVAVLPYSQALHRFPAHLQQCDMESNGKSVTRMGEQLRYKSGPVVWGEPGTNGQHAFYQLLHQGTEIVPVEFIGFRKSQCNQDVEVDGTTSQQKLLANLHAQMIAFAQGKESENPNRLFKGNRPSCLLLADKLIPETMGALLAVYEAKIVFQGFVWNINSFDQEGVQLGKVLAQNFLALLKGDGKTANGVEEWFLQNVVKGA